MPEEKPNVDQYGLTQTDYVKAALSWQYNWIVLAGAGGFAVMSGDPMPLVLAAGFELMYLALVPQSERFRRLVRSWRYRDEKKAHEAKLNELFRELPVEMRSRYGNVQEVARAIRANYSRLSSGSQMFSKQMEEKLTGLLHSYVRLLHAAYTHREYLRSTNPEFVSNGIAALEQSLPSEPPKVQEINTRRIEIMRKRLEKFEKIRENREVIDAQCAAMEDVLQLIRDQSVTMRDPQEVSAQLDHLVEDVEQTEQSVREMEAIFSMATPESMEDLQLPQASDTPQGRTKVRNQ